MGKGEDQRGSLCHLVKVLEKVSSIKQVHLLRKLVALPSTGPGVADGCSHRINGLRASAKGHEVRLGQVPRRPAPARQGRQQSLAASLLGQPSHVEPAGLSGVGLRSRVRGRGDAGRDSSR